MVEPVSSLMSAANLGLSPSGTNEALAINAGQTIGMARSVAKAGQVPKGQEVRIAERAQIEPAHVFDRYKRKAKTQKTTEQKFSPKPKQRSLGSEANQNTLDVVEERWQALGAQKLTYDQGRTQAIESKSADPWLDVSRNRDFREIASAA